MSDCDQGDKCKQPFLWGVSVCTPRMQSNTSLWLPALLLSQRLGWQPRSGLSLGIKSPQNEKEEETSENREHWLRTGRSIGKEEKDEVWRSRMESRGRKGHWWEGREIGRTKWELSGKKILKQSHENKRQRKVEKKAETAVWNDKRKCRGTRIDPHTCPFVDSESYYICSSLIHIYPTYSSGRLFLTMHKKHTRSFSHFHFGGRARHFPGTRQISF